MTQRKGLVAKDELERQILEKVAAAPEGRKRAATDALHRSGRDRVDEMWAGSPMRVHEARALAGWLGYDLRLVRVMPREQAPAYAVSNEARGQPSRDKRRAV